VSKPGRLPLLAVLLLGLATLALVTATPIAAQRSNQQGPAAAAKIAKSRPANCYPPAKVPGATTDLPFSKLPTSTLAAAQAACPGGVAVNSYWSGLVVGFTCIRCGSNIQLSDGTCLKKCSAGYVWKAVTRVGAGQQCCKATSPVGPFPDPQKYKTK
jgi:hypothetical protein